jgi:hypothetical protein
MNTADSRTGITNGTNASFHRRLAFFNRPPRQQLQTAVSGISDLVPAEITIIDSIFYRVYVLLYQLIRLEGYFRRGPTA